MIYEKRNSTKPKTSSILTYVTNSQNQEVYYFISQISELNSNSVNPEQVAGPVR